MKRRIGILVAGSLLAAAIGLVAPPGAQAANCVGQGQAILNKNIGLPVIGGNTNVGFTLSSNCVGGAPVFSSGTLTTAACGRSVGAGTINGKPFKLQTAGSLLVITGTAKGVGNAVANPLVPVNSCANKTAHQFLVTAAVTGV